MKHSRRVMVAILAVACVATIGMGVSRAQDPVKVAPGIYKVILENDHVRVLEVTLKPGEKVPMHSHPASVVLHENSRLGKNCLSVEVCLRFSCATG